jgi:hypothetical protein
MSEENKHPLFITRFSLSDTTAIGVQTRNYLKEFPSWEHVFWSSNELHSIDPRSRPLESYIFRRLGVLKRSTAISKVLKRLGLSWWSGEKPSTHARRVIGNIRRRVNCAYIAPLDEADAARMRAILEQLDVPFGVHLWDYLSGPPDENETPNLWWLIKHAAQVWALTSSLADDSGAPPAKLSRLAFTREESLSKACFRDSVAQPLRVALIGDVLSYKEGVEVLLDAVALLKAEKISVSLGYIGPAHVARLLDRQFGGAIKYEGFFTDRRERDRALASFHFGYLPGPLKAPDRDLRSKYSVPSRILDYLAVGLPIVGCAHSLSATANLARDVGIDTSDLSSATAIAEYVRNVGVNFEKWSQEQQAAKTAFTSFKEPGPASQLKQSLDNLARKISS